MSQTMTRLIAAARDCEPVRGLTHGFYKYPARFSPVFARARPRLDAEQFGKDVSMLLDDVGDPNMRTLEMMAREAIRRRWEGRALAHHCRAMALYSGSVFRDVVTLLRRARV